MLKKEQIITILKKYGYDSFYRAPYVYEDKEKIGVYFVWNNKHYGNLERVLSFSSEQDLEDEVYKYWWYFSNKDKAVLDVEFDNYEVVNPQVFYKHKGKILDVEKMKNFFNTENNFIDEKETIKRNQLFRTATIFILILKEKFAVQTNTYFKVSEMDEEIKNLTSTYQKKMKEYQNSEEVIEENYELLMDNQDETEQLINTLYEELHTLNTIEEIRTFINSMFTYLQDLEASETHLQNVYLLHRYPYEIADLKKKIEILSMAMQNRKRLFKNKQDPLDIIKQIDAQSEINKIVSLPIYMEKERKRMIEKYQNKEEIDENVLGDYLVNFEKLNIELPEMIENARIEEMDRKELIKILKNRFEKLNKREKSACFVATSFLKDCLNILIEKEATSELSINSVINKLILAKQIDLFNDAFSILDTYINAKIRVKYFNIININSFEKFITSLIDVLRTLNSMDIYVEKMFHGYYTEKDKEKGMINFHVKNIFNYKDKISYVSTIYPKATIYYSPVNIVKQLDIIENTELVERENDTVFLLKNKVNIKTKQEKIEVKRYEKGKTIQEKDYLLITQMKEKCICNFYEDKIYNKENGGFYG